jgi:hypothetical protein
LAVRHRLRGELAERDVTHYAGAPNFHHCHRQATPIMRAVGVFGQKGDLTDPSGDTIACDGSATACVICGGGAQQSPMRLSW